MSAVSSAFWDLAGKLRSLSSECAVSHRLSEQDYEIDGRVMPHHRRDGFRSLSVRSGSRGFILDLQAMVRSRCSGMRRQVTIYIGTHSEDGAGYVLSMNIWPSNDGPFAEVVQEPTEPGSPLT